MNDSIVEAKLKVQKAKRLRDGSLRFAAIAFAIIALNYGSNIYVPSIVVGLAWFVGPMSFLSWMGSSTEEAMVELEKLESRKTIYFGFLNTKTDEAYFDQLVKINIDNLREYYALVKVHTGRSFNLSIFVAFAGFLLIAAGLAAGFINEGLKNVSYLSTASGSLVEFIAGTMFYIYSKTVRQLKSYHDSLLDVQNILLSFKLIEGTSDEKERSAMTQKMIEFLVGNRLSEIPPTGNKDSRQSRARTRRTGLS